MRRHSNVRDAQKPAANASPVFGAALAPGFALYWEAQGGGITKTSGLGLGRRKGVRGKSGAKGAVSPIGGRSAGLVPADNPRGLDDARIKADKRLTEQRASGAEPNKAQ